MRSQDDVLRALRKPSVVVGGVLLLLLALLALALRLFHVGAQSLWYDEGFSVYLARMDLGQITSRTAADIQPPLYYYLLHVWIGLFGDGEIALRGLSVLFGFLSVPLIAVTAYLLFPDASRQRGSGTGRLTTRWLAALLAALLLAVSPLHIWYGQEVRMYSLLIFLCLLSSTLLLLAIRASTAREAILVWAAYAIVSSAALYSHYFAFFILAFQAVYVLAVWAGQGFRPLRLILGATLSGMVILTTYLPWLPYLINRYGTDASYWPGQLKILEVLADIAILFVGGESVSESVGLALAAVTGVIMLVCVLALLLGGARRESSAARGEPQVSSRPPRLATVSDRPRTSAYPLLFLLLFLLLPPALILLLSYNTPKFNARYVMVSHPALILLQAGGLAVLMRPSRRVVASVLRWGLAAVALAFLVGAAAYANFQALTAPDIARADFRGVAAYLREYMQPDETIILVSGHIYPVFDYYAQGLDRHLLPDSETLDVTRTLDYSIAAELNEWLTGRGGVWLVLWQDEVVDPVGYLPAMLADVAQEQPVDRTFAQVRLRHFRLPAGVRFADGPRIDHPADYNFGDKLRLLGYKQTGPWQVTLFWQALQTLDEDYRVSVVLRDTLGQGWGQRDGRPGSYLYPTSRWREGQVVFGRYDLVPMPGTPPGDYGLDVGVYTEADPIGLDVLDSAGAAQGKRIVLGAVRLSVPAATAEEVQVPHLEEADAGGGLILLGWDLGRYEAQPGDRVQLTLVWSARAAPQVDYLVRLIVRDSTAQVLNAGRYPPTNTWHPTTQWEPGQAWRGQITFRLPIQAQPGEGQLSIQLVDTEDRPAGPAIEISAFDVLTTTRTFEAPRPQVPRPANFGNRIQLLGADLSASPVPPGGALMVTLYWQALAEMDVPYTVFVHLLGLDGRVVASHDGQPDGGARPTTGWVPGEYITDLHEIQVPADLAAGGYVIEVGLYDAGVSALPRLSILSDGGEAVTDRVIFGPVQIR